jgi:hypothetical protein
MWQLTLGCDIDLLVLPWKPYNVQVFAIAGLQSRRSSDNGRFTLWSIKIKHAAYTGIRSSVWSGLKASTQGKITKMIDNKYFEKMK